ncbi:hypothetical protein JTB14_015737 [Gonioctena quinquepunctata]|nr:hypothetical protein JTB14_015737 [Gonioctena quinquepunctata]
MSTFHEISGSRELLNWKFGMELYPRDLNLWRDVNGYPTDDKTNDATKKKYDQRALTKIELMVAPCCYLHVRNCKTTKEMRVNLEKAFEDTGLNRRIQPLHSRCSLWKMTFLVFLF